MSIKEMFVDREGLPAPVPIKFGYEPFRREDIDSLNPKNLPYLIMAIINQEGDARIALGNASNHTEFSGIINREIKKPYVCEYGQVWLESESKSVKKVTLHHTSGEGIEETETEKTINLIVRAFDPKLLRQEGVTFTYNATAGDSWEYSPGSGKIVKHPLESF